MKEQKPSQIEEAPSLADITSADDRVGKVDFTSRLGDRADDESGDQPGEPGEPVDPLTSMVRPQRPAGDAGDDGPRMPFILPPAKVDAAMTAEAERTRLEIAAARGELVDDEPADDLDDELDDEPTDDPADGEVTDDAADLDDAAAPDAAADDTDDQREPAVGERDDAPRAPAPEGLVISEVADLDAVAAAVAHLEAAEASRDDAVGFADDDLRPLPATASDDDAPMRSVEQVAGAVIAAMRRINEAHERHVEALEIETARRCELLTAQAELDAELIRLHARREAHAIISAARARTGERDPDLADDHQLGEIGETFSRFAETIETTVAPGPGSPDHLRKP